MPRAFSFWFCGLMMVLSTSVLAQGDTVLLRDLSYRWEYMLPDGDVTTTPRAASAVMVREQLQDREQLILAASIPTDVWLNDQLHASGFVGIIVLDTAQVGKAPFDLVLCAMGRIDHTVVARIVSVGVATEDPLNMTARVSNVSAQVLALSLIIVIAGAYKFFFQFSFTGLFARLFYSSRVSAEEDAASFGGLRTLLGLLVLAMVLAFVTAAVSPENFRGLLASDQFLWRWLSDLLLIFALLLGKQAVALLLAPLHGLSDLPNIQVKDFIEVFGLGVLLVFVIALTDFFSFQQVAALNFARSALVVLWVSYPLWSLWRLRKVTGNRKLVIISYLCTTEFLPGFLAVFWLMKG